MTLVNKKIIHIIEKTTDTVSKIKLDIQELDSQKSMIKEHIIAVGLIKPINKIEVNKEIKDFHKTRVRINFKRDNIDSNKHTTIY